MLSIPREPARELPFRDGNAGFSLTLKRNCSISPAGLAGVFAALLLSAFAVGATAIVARSMGARRVRVAQRVAGTAIAGAFCVSVCVAALLFLFSSQVAHIAGLRGQAHAFGTSYLHIMVITIALQGAGMIGMACLRGSGDTLRPMLIAGGVAAINIVTSSSFCFGWLGAPAWGLQGNAFGTMLAYLLGGVATLILLLGGWGKLKLQTRHFRIVPHILVRLLRIGLPAWAEAARDHGNLRGHPASYAISLAGILNGYISSLLAAGVALDARVAREACKQFMSGIYAL